MAFQDRGGLQYTIDVDGNALSYVDNLEKKIASLDAKVKQLQKTISSKTGGAASTASDKQATKQAERRTKTVSEEDRIKRSILSKERQLAALNNKAFRDVSKRVSIERSRLNIETQLAKLKDRGIQKASAELEIQRKIANYRKQQAVQSGLKSFAQQQGITDPAQLKKLGVEVPKVSNRFDQLNETLSRWRSITGSSTLSLTRLFRVFTFYTVVNNLTRALKEAISTLFTFNSNLEQTTLAATGIIAELFTVVDASGNIVKGAQAFELAGDIARGQLELIRKDALLTASTFQELNKNFQVALAPGAEAGLNLDEIRKITLRFSQIASGIDLPQNQLAEELRSVLQGTITRRNTRIATILGLTNEDIRRWREAGTLFEELTKRTEQFARVGEIGRNTFKGLLSNLRDAFELLLGRAGLGAFNNLKDVLRGILDTVVTVDKVTGNVKLNPEILKLAEEFGNEVAGLVDYFKSIAGEAGSLVEILSKLGAVIRLAVVFITEFVRTLLSIVGIGQGLFKIFSSIGISTEKTVALIGKAVAIFTILKAIGAASLGILESALAVEQARNAIIAKRIALQEGSLALEGAATGAASAGAAAKATTALSGALIAIGRIALLIGVIYAAIKGIEYALSKITGQDVSIGTILAGAVNQLVSWFKQFVVVLKNLPGIFKDLIAPLPLIIVQGILKGVNTVLDSLFLAFQKGAADLFERGKEKGGIVGGYMVQASGLLKNLEKGFGDASTAVEKGISGIDDKLAALGKGEGLKKLNEELEPIKKEAQDITDELLKMDKEKKKASDPQPVIDLRASIRSLSASVIPLNVNLGETQKVLDDINKTVREAETADLSAKLSFGVSSQTSSSVQAVIKSLEDYQGIQRSFDAQKTKIQNQQKANDNRRIEALSRLSLLSDREKELSSRLLDIETKILDAKKAQNGADQNTANSLQRRIEGLIREGELIAKQSGLTQAQADNVAKISEDILKTTVTTNALTTATEELSKTRDEVNRDAVRIFEARNLGKIQLNIQAVEESIIKAAREFQKFSATSQDEIDAIDLKQQLDELDLLAEKSREAFREALQQVPEGATNVRRELERQQKLEQQLIKERRALAESRLLEVGTVGDLALFTEREFNKAFDSVADQFGVALANMLAGQEVNFQNILGNILLGVAQEFGKALVNEIIAALGARQAAESVGSLVGGAVKKIDGLLGGTGQDASISAGPGIPFLGNITDFFTSTIPGLLRSLSGSLFGGIGSLFSLFFAEGGMVPQGFARGGIARPRGIDPRDTVPAWLRPGEMVIRPEAVQKYGSGLLASLNNMSLNPNILPAVASPSIAANVAQGVVSASRGGIVNRGMSGSGSNRGGSVQVLPVMISSESQLERMLNGGQRTFNERVSTATKGDPRQVPRGGGF